jgi:hypothetical protein
MKEWKLDRIYEDLLKTLQNGIKIKKDHKKITVQIYTHNPYWSLGMLVSFTLFILPIIVIIIGYGYYEGYYEYMLNMVNRVVSARIDLRFGLQLLFFFLIPFVSIYFIIKAYYNVLYAAFGKIELTYGTQNYIFNGLFRFGKKYNVNWNNIDYFYQHGNFPSSGLEFSAPVSIVVGGYPVLTPMKQNYFLSKDASNTIGKDFIVIGFKDKNEIKIHPKYLSDTKVNYLFYIIHYFKNN